MNTTRRVFLLGSAAVVGGVAVGYHWRDRLPRPLRPLSLAPGETALSPYVIIDREGITLIAPRAEMGQGIHTTLAALVAEELDVTLEQVRVAHGQASEHYSNNALYGEPRIAGWAHSGPTQATGAQSSSRDAFIKMRKAGAAARAVLLEAAAARWGVPVGGLSTAAGVVRDGHGNSSTYVELAQEAAAFTPPADPPLKAPAEWRLLGTSLPRVDMVSKCTGTAQYGIDVMLPDMLFATVKRNPHLGGRMLAFDASRAQGMRGVRRIIPMDNGLIVIASNTWYAMQAIEAVDFDWAPASHPDSTQGHRARVEAAFDGEPYARPRDTGDVDGALASAEGDVLESAYRVPYLAHMTMEPLNATALLSDDRLDIWAGNQFPTLAVQVGAHLTGLREKAVNVHTPYLGGGFGRRFEMDDVQAAVIAARAVPGTPVRVTYKREEDISHDTYRPMASARLRAAVVDGKPNAIDVHLSVPSLFTSGNERRHLIAGDPSKGVAERDQSMAMGAKGARYRIANLRVTTYRPDKLLPVGWWRSVGESQNSFFVESFMDEIAQALGRDPLDMRLSMLEHAPSRQVLESVAEMSNWGSPLPPGHARGLAFAPSTGAPVAEVIEISVEQDVVRLHKAYAAVEVGVALDRRNIEGQVQGAMLFGLSAAIFGEVTIDGGRVSKANYHDYPLLRFAQAPKTLEVRVHESAERLYGVGEIGVPSAAPALANAIFAATGQRLRELPLSRHFRFV
ncbi:MAG: molybdopterin cofactor-binding domain-containing protein [Pseudomonadota bacterium]